MSSLYARTAVWLHKFKSEVRQHEFVEQLIDPNNKQLTVKLRFRISYLPPDSHLADVAAVDLPGDTLDALGSDRDKSMSAHPWQLEQFHTVNYGMRI